MALLKKLAAKQRADKLRAQLRLEKRRGYARTGRERERAKALAESGILDLPPQVQAQLTEATAPTPTAEPKHVDATVEDLVARLVAIRERIFRLSAVFAVSLSWDCAVESNKYLTIFQDLAAQLEEKDTEALANITRGFESLLLSPPFQTRRTIPVETQRMAELRWEAAHSPARRAPKPPAVSDGLDWLVS